MYFLDFIGIVPFVYFVKIVRIDKYYYNKFHNNYFIAKVSYNL